MGASRPLTAKAMALLAVLLVAAALAPQPSAAQPVTAVVKDEGAEAVSDAIQTAISEQDGKTAAQLIAQAFAAREKPNLGQATKPLQNAPTPVVLPDKSKIDSATATSSPSDDAELPNGEDETKKVAQAFADGGLPTGQTGRRLLRATSW